MWSDSVSDGLYQTHAGGAAAFDGATADYGFPDTSPNGDEAVYGDSFLTRDADAATSSIIWDSGQSVDEGQAVEWKFQWNGAVGQDVGFMLVDPANTTGYGDFDGFLYFLNQAADSVHILRRINGGTTDSTAVDFAIPAGVTLTARVDYGSTQRFRIFDENYTNLVDLTLDAPGVGDGAAPGYYGFDITTGWHVDCYYQSGVASFSQQ